MTGPKAPKFLPPAAIGAEIERTASAAKSVQKAAQEAVKVLEKLQDEQAGAQALLLEHELSLHSLEDQRDISETELAVAQHLARYFASSAEQLAEGAAEADRLVAGAEVRLKSATESLREAEKATLASIEARDRLQLRLAAANAEHEKARKRADYPTLPRPAKDSRSPSSDRSLSRDRKRSRRKSASPRKRARSSSRERRRRRSRSRSEDRRRRRAVSPPRRRRRSSTPPRRRRSPSPRRRRQTPSPVRRRRRSSTPPRRRSPKRRRRSSTPLRRRASPVRSSRDSGRRLRRKSPSPRVKRHRRSASPPPRKAIPSKAPARPSPPVRAKTRSPSPAANAASASAAATLLQPEQLPPPPALSPLSPPVANGGTGLHLSLSRSPPARRIVSPQRSATPSPSPAALAANGPEVPPVQKPDSAEGDRAKGSPSHSRSSERSISPDKPGLRHGRASASSASPSEGSQPPPDRDKRSASPMQKASSARSRSREVSKGRSPGRRQSRSRSASPRRRLDAPPPRSRSRGHSRDRDRPGPRGDRRGGPVRIDSRTRDLFVDALRMAIAQRPLPFNVSVVNDFMRGRERFWKDAYPDVPFTLIARAMEDEGWVVLQTIRHTAMATDCPRLADDIRRAKEALRRRPRSPPPPMRHRPSLSARHARSPPRGYSQSPPPAAHSRSPPVRRSPAVVPPRTRSPARPAYAAKVPEVEERWEMGAAGADDRWHMN